MIATVTLYYDTGLGPGNSMDGVDKLALFTSRTFSDVAVKQDLMLMNIRLAATFNDVKGADYCKINDMCYYITSLVMLNDNVANLIIQPDFVTTVGVSDLQFTSGWIKRRHYSANEDRAIFTNLFDEPFEPTNEPVLERGTVIQGGGSSNTFHYILVSSLELTTMSNVAKKYINTLDGGLTSILVPQLPDGIDNNHATVYTSHCVDPAKSSVISMTKAFNLLSSTILNAMNDMRSLGIESAISAAYVLPDIWGDADNSATAFSSISDRSRSVNSNIETTYNVPGHNIINNKTFSGQFNKVKVFSMCSGDEHEFRIEDIIFSNEHGSTLIAWYVYADCKYNGAPGCKPLYYRGVRNTDTSCCIRGANWQQTPFMYNQASGWGLDRAQATLNAKSRIGGLGTEALGQAGDAIALGVTYKEVGGLKGFAEGIGTKTEQTINEKGYNGISSAVASNVRNNAINARQSRLNLYGRRIQGYGQLDFPQVPYLADYIGNAFYDVRTRLSDKDTVRFDNFLSAYGYAVDEGFKDFSNNNINLFFTRTKHNYVQTDDAVVKKTGIPLMLLNGVSEELNNGVRIWHVAPSIDDLYNNTKA